MIFPSLKNLRQNIAATFKRFPFEMLFAFTGTIASIAYIELNNLNYLKESWCIRVLMTSSLGLVISLATTLFCESKGFRKSQLLLFKLIAACLAISLIFILNPLVNSADYIRFFLLALAGHLLVAFSAFIKQDSIQGFWQFNKTLFLNFLTSAFYSAVLFAGIAAAIGAMNLLFSVDFKSDTFAILWVCITGLFNTLFFLAGVPNDFPKLNQDFNYPKGLKIFTQYVLIPLATLYVVILLAYEIKILIQWRLPKGLVSNLILGYAVFGILSLLLIFPIREQAENKWIKTFARTFYFLMLPLLTLLFIAVGTRIFLYGITEPRYFLILLAFWLLFITIYFLVSKKQNIKVIPISLCLVTILSVYGPQSAFSVSRYAQKTILIDIFKRNHAYQNNQLLRINKTSKEDGNRAVATIDYLINHNDLTIFQPYITQDLKAVSDSLSKLKDAYGHTMNTKYEISNQRINWLVTYFGLKKFSGYRYPPGSINEDETQFYDFNIRQSEVVEVIGYDFIIDQTNINYSDVRGHYVVGKTLIETNTGEEGILQITLDHETILFNLKELMSNVFKDESRLKPYIRKTTNEDPPEYILPAEMLSFTKKNEEFQCYVQAKVNTDISR
ncbi:DUF4153 domain-containing protein [Pedobacter lusitanus]|uniref:DUF4153 domain-containing protein n=1 Tax=Pedobacter lusitanus TaxID=1503925 RepID=UPI000696CD02|nr:DUF4153 domain-containing protein [Pedobacter lusitanus]